MDYKDALHNVVIPGLKLLPKKMDTPEARVMLLTIGKQESRFLYRKQIGGPARGFYQFEEGGGVRGVLNHPATQNTVLRVLDTLDLLPSDCYDCLAEPEHDALATVFARLLLYTHPKPLPSLNSDPDVSWRYYLDTWRPGKPHRGTWNDFLINARNTVKGA